MTTSEDAAHAPTPRIVLLAALGVALLALGLYLRTLHPGVGPSIDSIELHTAVAVGGLIHPPGSPQYLMLGRLATMILPGPGVAYRLNLFSALCAAATVGVVYLLTYRLTRHLAISVFASLMLALSPRLWYQASIAELYALNALYVALTVYFLLAWHQTRKTVFYRAATVVYAFSFGNHLSMILLLPVFLYAVAITDPAMLSRPRDLLITAGIVLLAALQYLYIPLRAAANPPFCNYCPGPLPDLFRYVSGPLFDYLTGGPFKGAIFGLPRREILARLPDSIGAWNRQFMPWGYALGIVGVWELLRREGRIAWLLLPGIAAEYIFVIGYNIPDWHDFLTPVYVLFTPLLGYGVLSLWRVLEEEVRRLTLQGRWLVSFAYPAGLLALGGLALMISLYTNLPLVDQSRETAFEVNGRALLEQAQPGDWLLMPPPNSGAFYYSWAIRYLSFVDDSLPDLVVITPPEINPPPGPSPYYEAWDTLAPRLTAEAMVADPPRLFVLDPSDPRVADWGLLPVCAPDGETIAGYEVVAVRLDGEIRPLVDDERWRAIRGAIVFGGEEAHCP